MNLLGSFGAFLKKAITVYLPLEKEQGGTVQERLKRSTTVYTVKENDGNDDLNT